MDRRWFLKGTLLVPAVATIVPGWINEVGKPQALIDESAIPYGGNHYPNQVRDSLIAVEKIWIEGGRKEFDSSLRWALRDSIAGVFLSADRRERKVSFP